MKKLILLACLAFLVSSCSGQKEKAVVSTPTQNESKQSQNENVNKVEEFLSTLSEKSELPFSEPGSLDFTWKIAGEKLGKIRNIEKTELSGLAIALIETPRIEEDSNIPVVTYLSNLFTGMGFQRNLYNSRAGTTDGTEAFDKDGLSCLVNWEIINGIEGYKITGVPMNVAVVCGDTAN